MTINAAERTELSKLSNKATGIVHHNSKFVDHTKKRLIFAIFSEKAYKQKFVATHIKDNVKDTMGSELLTGMST